MQLPSVQEMEAYIRQAAQARGIDPDIAVRVARSEGLAPDTWQSNVRLKYGREQSYGPFQLHVAPDGYKPGMGNDFVKATGLNPADPSTWKQGVDFALDNAAKGGWSPWFGRKNVGVDVWDGIAGAQALGVSPAAPPPPAPPMGTAMGGFQGGPAQVTARQQTGILPNIQPAVGQITADFRPTYYQQSAFDRLDEEVGLSKSQRGMRVEALGLDPTGKKRLNPRGMNNPGILSMLQNKFDMPKLQAAGGDKGGILGKIFGLFG